ncbi:MAG: hypothetical protein NDI90_19560 [Nitrospira sp. BO4]|jgi:hypothetical protein|nr:hypothetical protein [Nitrospira sp. BO4]
MRIGIDSLRNSVAYDKHRIPMRLYLGAFLAGGIHFDGGDDVNDQIRSHGGGYTNYKGITMHSWPCESAERKGLFKRRVEIFFPKGNSRELIDPFVRGKAIEDNFPYSSFDECYEAGFEWGRKIIDEWELTGLR